MNVRNVHLLSSTFHWHLRSQLTNYCISYVIGTEQMEIISNSIVASVFTYVLAHKLPRWSWISSSVECCFVDGSKVLIYIIKWMHNNPMRVTFKYSGASIDYVRIRAGVGVLVKLKEFYIFLWWRGNLLTVVVICGCSLRFWTQNLTRFHHIEINKIGLIYANKSEQQKTNLWKKTDIIAFDAS